MRAQRKRRLYFIMIMLVGVASAVSLALFALRQNIDLYFTPSQLFSKPHQTNRMIRVGGLVLKKSLHHKKNSLKVTFVLTDYHHQLKVAYDGILPSLFREGQGIVAEGHLGKSGVFKADRVLAKHDANYHPPNISKQGSIKT